MFQRLQCAILPVYQDFIFQMFYKDIINAFWNAIRKFIRYAKLLSNARVLCVFTLKEHSWHEAVCICSGYMNEITLKVSHVLKD